MAWSPRGLLRLFLGAPAPTVPSRHLQQQRLSTLLFRWWSEVPSRGGVRGDSPLEKRPASQRGHIHVCLCHLQPLKV